MDSRLIAHKQDMMKKEADADVPFPSSRYFQVHFEYLYELIDDLKQQLEKTNRQIAALKRHVDDHTDGQEVDAICLNTDSGVSLQRLPRRLRSSKIRR